MPVNKTKVTAFLELMAASLNYSFMPYISPLLVVLSIVLLCSRFWFVMVLYLIWIWIFDVNVAERGGRSITWVRNLRIWEYARNYFPIELITAPGFTIEAKKNYLFCGHPHSILPWAGALIFTNNRYWPIFSSLNCFMFTLGINFLIPFYRDVLLAMGFCSVSAKGMNSALNSFAGGNAGFLIPGGSDEVFTADSGTYHFCLRKRKGFIKLALRGGYSIVPTISFGEVDIWRQVKNPLLTNIQKLFKRFTQFVPVYCVGRWNMPIPHQTPIHVVFGEPIDVAKNESPSDVEINELHEKYIQRITEQFEKYKYFYVKNPETTKLIID